VKGDNKLCGLGEGQVTGSRHQGEPERTVLKQKGQAGEQGDARAVQAGRYQDRGGG
jgi:hypothetical protein